MAIQKTKAKRKSSWDLKNLCILPENLAEGLGSRREHCWGDVSIYGNTPKKLLQCPQKVATIYLVVQGRMQLEHSSHIVKVVVEATC